VREPREYQICHLDGKLIPLGQLRAGSTSSTATRTSSCTAAAADAARTRSRCCAAPASRTPGT
jgi:hypothetical protein